MRARLPAVSNQSRPTPLRAAALLLVVLFFAGQGAAAAADARSESRQASAWVRARSVSARPFAAPDCGSAALPLSPIDVAPTGAVVRAPRGTAAPVLVPTSACPRSAFPRGPPLPA